MVRPARVPPARRRLAGAAIVAAAAASVLTGCGDGGAPPAAPAEPAVPPPAEAGAPAPAELSALPGEPRLYNVPFREEAERADAATDGWDTEVWQERAGRVLHDLVALVTDDPAIILPALDPAESGLVIDEEVAVHPLRPALEVVFEDAGFTVLRPTDPAPGPGPQQGRSALAGALADFGRPLRAASDPHFKTKVFTIEPGTGRTFLTRALVTTSGRTDAGLHQQNGTWECRWRQDDTGSPPRLLAVRSLAHEEVSAGANGQPLFADATAATFADPALFRDHLRHGVGYWRSRVERTLAPDIVGMIGVAVGDVNGDGLDDVYLCQPYGLPNRLLVQQPDGTVVDTAPASGLDWLDPVASALFVDFDNDGDEDLVLGGDASASSLFFHANDGRGRFTERRRVPFPVVPTSLAAADFDGDRLVDLYVCGHTPASAEQRESVLGLPVPFFDADNGQPNMLLKNTGAFGFREVTASVGLVENNHRFSYAAAWEDFDNDGDLDLYVANDFGRNNLYRQDEGRFTDVAADAGVEDVSSGMSVSWGDYDRDGWMDLYVGNMFSGAGNRITYQRRFRPGEDSSRLGLMRRMARGNSLFRNEAGRFRDVSIDLGVTMGRWAWASRFLDLNNDGWEDLAIANGFVTNRRPDDL